MTGDDVTFIFDRSFNVALPRVSMEGAADIRNAREVALSEKRKAIKLRGLGNDEIMCKRTQTDE